MSIQEKLYTVEDLWEMELDPDNDGRHFYVIDGELFESALPGQIQGRLAALISFHLARYNRKENLGEVTVKTGFHPPDARYTLLLPDVAYMRLARLPDPPPEAYVPEMPDLAVEILSPSDTITKARRKAEIYLQNGTTLVWLVQSKRQGVEVCRLVADSGPQLKFAGQSESLSGEGILPGFELEIDLLFPPSMG